MNYCKLGVCKPGSSFQNHYYDAVCETPCDGHTVEKTPLWYQMKRGDQGTRFADLFFTNFWLNKMGKLETIIEINKLENEYRKNGIEDKSKQQKY